MSTKAQAALDWVLDRLGEQSTWKGIIGLITAFGVVLKPDQAAHIIAAGLALGALINVTRNEKKASGVAADAAVVRAVNAGTVAEGPVAVAPDNGVNPPVGHPPVAKP